MTNPYPNVSVALGMNAKVSGSFKNAKSRLKNIFQSTNISDLKKKLFGSVFYGGYYVSGFFVKFLNFPETYMIIYF